MEVVTGLKPKLPQTLAAGLPIRDVGVDQYVAELIDYFASTYKEVREKGLELARATEGTLKAGPGSPLSVGDLVLRMKNDKTRPKGSHRFEDRTESPIYKVSRKVGESTVEVETLQGDPMLGPNGLAVRLDASNLIKLDMPELEVDLARHQQRMLELRDHDDFTVWKRAVIEKVLPDSTVVLRYDGDPHHTHVVDLTQHCYRWVYGDGEAEPIPGAAASGQ